MSQPSLYVRIVKHDRSIPAWITTDVMTLDEAIQRCQFHAKQSGYDVEAIGSDNERIYLAKGSTEL